MGNHAQLNYVFGGNVLLKIRTLAITFTQKKNWRYGVHNSHLWAQLQDEKNRRSHWLDGVQPLILDFESLRDCKFHEKGTGSAKTLVSPWDLRSGKPRIGYVLSRSINEMIPQATSEEIATDGATIQQKKISDAHVSSGRASFVRSL
jgi:hypothetical protein